MALTNESTPMSLSCHFHQFQKSFSPIIFLGTFVVFSTHKHLSVIHFSYGSFLSPCLGGC